jgi:hypothetical protein
VWLIVSVMKGIFATAKITASNLLTALKPFQQSALFPWKLDLAKHCFQDGVIAQLLAVAPSSSMEVAKEMKTDMIRKLSVSLHACNFA